MTAPTSTPSFQSQSTSGWAVKLLYDGDCPFCQREVDFLKRRDGGRGRVAFVNIADADYDPAAHAGVSYEAAMGRIHAVMPDDTIIRDVEVFRRVYDILDMGWVYSATRWPIIRPIVDWLYARWADWRLPLTGRPRLEQILATRQSMEGCDQGDRCRLP